ncbi:MAG: hypothetical protein KBI32_10070, partial [Phycisphaerae bacterium]|nr:hypothetical protein [Phycisphaerae bacterium]
MKSHPTPSMTTFRSILHILNINFSFLSSLLIGTVPIYAKLGLVGLTLFSPLLLAGKANAKDIEGSLWIDYYVDSIGGYTCGLNFIEGAKDGWDNFDFAYYELSFPDDAHVKGVGSIEGREAAGVSYPPLTDTIGSSGGTSFNGSIVVNSGKSITLDNASNYLKCWFRGLEGCKVYVNGQDISTNSTVNLGTLTGTFGEGEHPTATWTVHVEYVGTNGGGEDPTEPNETGETNNDVEKPAPGRLLIENVISRSSQITSVELALEDGATEGIKEGEDTLYPRFTGIPPVAILSRIGETYLTADKRPNTSNSNFFLEQVFFSHSGSAYNPWTQENSLVFTFPEENGKINEKFPGRILTLQEYVPSINDPNIPDPNAMTYPVYLIRDLIEDGNGVGVVNLSDMPKGTIYAGTWHNFILRTDAKTVPLAIADFDSNGRVDSNDVSMLESALGHVGNSKYDIAGTNSKG